MTDMDRDTSESGRQGYTQDIRQRALDAYDSARETASSATRRATGAIEDSPLVVLGAGIAAGALVAALLPTTRRERELLAPYGSKVTGAARHAADSARNAGSQKLQELGLMPDAILDKAGETVKTSAQAAASTFKQDTQGLADQVAKVASKASGKRAGRTAGGKR